VAKPFSVNINRFDPYKSFRFKVYFGTSTTPVAAASKVGGLKRSSDPIEYKEGGNPIIRKGWGRTKYDRSRSSAGSRMTLISRSGPMPRRNWSRRADDLARESAQRDSHRPSQRSGTAGAPLSRPSLLGLRVSGHTRSRCRRERRGPRAHQLENEGWERDLSLSEPTEI